LGRLLFDYSNLEEGTPVNNPLAKPLLAEKFGQLVMPSVASLYTLAEQVEEFFPGEVLHVGKDDVARAFQRMNWSSEASLLISLLLTDELVLVPTSLGFGSSCAPYAYGIVTRFFEFMHKRLVEGLQIEHPVTKLLLTMIGIIYCLDEIKVGSKRILVQMGKLSSRVIRTALGEDAVNGSKSIISTRTTTLGVLSDFANKTAAPGWRAFLKLSYVFYFLLPLQVSVTTKVSLRLIQAIAQLTLRYSTYIPVLRSTASGFFASIRGGKGNHRLLSQRQVDDILLWRSVLFVAVTHAGILQTTFSAVISLSKEYRHLADMISDCVVYSDASGRDSTPITLTPLPEAVGVYVPDVAWLFWEWPEDEIPIACIELLASIIAYMLCNFMLPNTKHCHLYIDNQNAISWSAGRVKTEDYLARNLTCLNSLIQGAYRDCFQSRQYIRSEDNHVADAISRRRFNLPELRNTPRYQLAPELIHFFLKLYRSSESLPLEIVAGQTTMLGLNSLVPFLPWQK
jgi:hypothetical protein